MLNPITESPSAIRLTARAINDANHAVLKVIRVARTISPDYAKLGFGLEEMHQLPEVKTEQEARRVYGFPFFAFLPQPYTTYERMAEQSDECNPLVAQDVHTSNLLVAAAWRQGVVGMPIWRLLFPGAKAFDRNMQTFDRSIPARPAKIVPIWRLVQLDLPQPITTWNRFDEASLPKVHKHCSTT